jgi:hypothetical protein
MPAARSRRRVASKSLTEQGPWLVQTTLTRTPKTPVRLTPCGRTSRWESRWSRRYASAGSAGGASRSMTVRTTVCLTPRRGSVPSSAERAAGTPNGLLVHGASPRRGSGYQVSSVSPSSVTVARPRPQAVRAVASVAPGRAAGALPVVTASVMRPILEGVCDSGARAAGRARRLESGA